MTYFHKTKQEFTVHHIRGKEPGPTLLIIAGIHGDEAGGYLSAERYANLKLKTGNLIIVPRLNGAAIRTGKRCGLGGDMNRLFNLPSNNSNPDAKVVNLVKQLIRQSDYVLNLHQGYDFYNPRWISATRNPSKWGQCNVIDAATFHLPDGQKLELENFAERVVHRANRRISGLDYHFTVNNTHTAVKWSRHREQRGSLTYYSLYNQQKIALGLEATKNCSLAEAVSYLTIAVNAAIEEAGIQAEALPSESSRSTGVQQVRAKGNRIKTRG
ncbi:MAG: succinylglutamate desuccinylase/aspartoacylase family protein [Deltaproteobacteria bacterium]|nr:succinylglutamate desuccinylase/aspartoacylase family protein [Deltaproteobacteria bacterium]